MIGIDHRVRHRALKLWTKQVPRKMIAELLNISEATLKSWREHYHWPVRKGTTALCRGKKKERVVTGACTYGCPACGMRASDPKGHAMCQEQVA